MSDDLIARAEALLEGDYPSDWFEMIELVKELVAKLKEAEAERDRLAAELAEAEAGERYCTKCGDGLENWCDTCRQVKLDADREDRLAAENARLEKENDQLDHFQQQCVNLHAENEKLWAVADLATFIAHGGDETCGKFPALEKALAALPERKP